MKHFTKLAGIIACAVIIGFSFASCGNGTTDGGGAGAAALANTTWVGTNAYGADYEVYFYPDGIGWLYASAGSDTMDEDFTYTVSGSRVTLYDLGGDLAASGTVSGNIMRLKDPAGNNITLTKVQ